MELFERGGRENAEMQYGEVASQFFEKLRTFLHAFAMRGAKPLQHTDSLETRT